MLSRDELPELIVHLTEGRDFCVDELSFEFIADRLQVRLPLGGELGREGGGGKGAGV